MEISISQAVNIAYSKDTLNAKIIKSHNCNVWVIVILLDGLMIFIHAVQCLTKRRDKIYADYEQVVLFFYLDILQILNQLFSSGSYIL